MTDDAGSDDRSATDLIGLTEEQARERAAAEGRAFRVVHRDGEDFIVTADYNPRRVNVFVQDGTVVDAGYH